MKKSLFIFCPLMFAVTDMLQSNNNSAAEDVQSAKMINAISCAPVAENIYADASGKFINILPGWGNHLHAITTVSDSAQMYFNQGLSMYYSYHSTEAVASFKEAARFDSNCAMAYWGQALAMGPPYNFGHLYKQHKNIPAVIAAMNSKAAHASQEEKDLMDAMNKRYNIADTADKQRAELNINYAAALKPLIAKYAADIDVKALYTDAVMLIHSWNFWNNDGTPKSWTPELVEYCKDILHEDPHHPAGLHYYIHVTEASRRPEVALASADSLIKLFPGIAHMVHMSSHEYERIGYYTKGVHANEAADRSLALYDSLAKGLFTAVHVPHYFAVESYCALSGGMYKQALQKAHDYRSIVKPTHENMYLQYQYMLPYFAMVRMGKWQSILNDTTSISSDWAYASLLLDFAKGMAHAKSGNYAEAEKYLAQLQQKRNNDILRTKFTPYMSSPYEVSAVAENILSANIFYAQKKYDEAIAAIQKAVDAEDNLLYTEPKIWMLPARQYLGAFLLQTNKPAAAEKVYREDLAWNPGNGWSLLGLYQSLQAQKKNKEMEKIKAQYMNSFAQAEEMPVASVY